MKQEKKHPALRALHKVKKRYSDNAFIQIENHHNDEYKNESFLIKTTDYFNVFDMSEDVAAEYSPIIAWNYAKLIYRFDVDAEEEIIKTELRGKIPCEIFLKMPSYCVFIESSKLTYEGKNITGFFSCVDYLDAFGSYAILFSFYHKNEYVIPYFFPLLPEKSLEEIISEIQIKIFKMFGSPDSDLLELIIQALSLTLFVCTQNSQITQKEKKKGVSRRNGFVIENDAVFNDVAVDIGRAIRLNKIDDKSRTGTHSEGRKSPRPHIRRAHWQGFWMGSKKEDNQVYDLRWLPPFPVAVKDNNAIPATIHKIKK